MCLQSYRMPKSQLEIKWDWGIIYLPYKTSVNNTMLLISFKFSVFTKLTIKEFNFSQLMRKILKLWKKFMDFGTFNWKTEICPIKNSQNENAFIGEKWKNISNKKVSSLNVLKSSLQIILKNKQLYWRNFLFWNIFSLFPQWKYFHLGYFWWDIFQYFSWMSQNPWTFL